MKILKINQKNLKEVVEIVIKSIKQGKVIICPSDTVYGLRADAANEKAIKKILKIKKRRTQKPIPILVKNIKMAKQLAFITKEQEKFLKNIWPGKVIVVLRRKNQLPKILFGKIRTIGLRIPKYKLVNILLKRLNRPLTGTSANISGRPHSTKIKEVLKQFQNQKYQPDLVIDAGNLPQSKPSTALDLTAWPPKILRP